VDLFGWADKGAAGGVVSVAGDRDDGGVHFGSPLSRSFSFLDNVLSVAVGSWRLLKEDLHFK
jgi:hypothetical protein